VLELAILGLLKEQPLHGYELKKRLGDTLGSFGGLVRAPLPRAETPGASDPGHGAPPVATMKP
jgi:hypothetical protein